MFRLILLIAVLTTSSILTVYSNETRLLRYPNASETEITFSYAGDIYIVPIEGGNARRITYSAGIEIFPRFSPDGKSIAFSGEHDGNREIYTIPNIGGEPYRVTYSMEIPGLPERMGPDKIIMQWSKDGKDIIYRSREKEWNPWVGKLYKINNKGGLPQEYPLPRAGFTSFSEDGKKIAYNRIFREFRTWKRYRGGQADDIWIYNFDNESLENITNNASQDIIPMWYKNKIYFISDRDHFMNLFVYDIESKSIDKVTKFDKYDIKFPSFGGKYITFENGGYIYLLDPETDEYKKINISINEDFPWNRTKQINVKNRISSWDVYPKAEKAVFCARGDIFTVPAKNGKTYNLTNSPGVHDRNAVCSPDGKLIAYISDNGDENEIYVMKIDGSSNRRLTSKSNSYIWEIKWSPDSKKIAFSDKLMKLYHIDIENGKVNEIVKSKQWEIRDYEWSPDSRWIAYTNYINNFTPQVFVYSLDENESLSISDEFFESTNPVFSKDGKYLFFNSYRDFKPETGMFEWNIKYGFGTHLFGVTLQNNTESPFAYNETLSEIAENNEQKDKNNDDNKEVKVIIDFDGIQNRIFEFPISKGNYGNIVSTLKNKLYYSRSGKFYCFDLKNRKEKKIGDFGAFIISNDEKNILYKKKSDYFISKLGSELKGDKDKVDFNELTFKVDRKAEWNQVFDESWRQMRDFFYDPNMHGVDWDAIKKKYEELLPYVNHRYDLTYIIGEMIGELNCGHSYVGGGDAPNLEKVGIGLLGADFEYDRGSDSYKIINLLDGRNWEEKTRSPLTEPGLNVNVGDYIFEIDGVELTSDVTPFKALVGKSKKYVDLKVNSRPNEKRARKITVKTISNENHLRYYNWVEQNRRKVDKATDGKVGYIHIPDMSMDGLNEFVKYFYPQLRKEALIVDDRFNGGGNVSPMIVERLRRILLVAKNARNQEIVGTNPDAVMTGPIVCLLNEISASDGDLFPYQFKKAGIGTLIGKRSWGGVIGIRGSLPFLDGSYLYKPEFANFGADGTWVLEGVGMTPDLEVDNHPAKEYAGVDEQLNKAIEVILKQIKTNKKTQIPKVPDYPDKSK